MKTAWASPSMKAAAAAVAVIATYTLGSAEGRATTFPSLEERGLATSSALVVRVRIASKHAELLGGPERRQKIATLHAATVVEVLQGALTPPEGEQGHLVVGLPGGIVGDIGQRVSGVPDLVVGEEYVLFLGPASGPGGARGVVGHALGTYRVSARGHLVPDREYGGHPSVPRRLDLLRAALLATGGALPGPTPADRAPPSSPAATEGQP